MRLKTFRGGIHPDDKKAATNKLPIKTPEPYKTMVFPMAQHIGKPSIPTVNKGDYVKMYQVIGEADGFFSVPVHSSVSGTVKAVEPMMTACGDMIMSVVIENDFLDEKADLSPPQQDEKLADIVQAAGIVGMGGATFPTHIKLSPPADKKIDVIIVNGSECEPYITSDHRVLLEKPEEILGGLRAVMDRMGVLKGVIAIESNKPDAIAKMKEISQGLDNITVTVLKTKYPQGSEKQLIEVVTGKQVPSGKLPMDVGAIVLNVDTCTAIYNAVTYGEPLVERIVTVVGSVIKSPANYRVRIGTPVRSLIELSGGEISKIAKVIAGGPMMGNAICSEDIPIVKGIGAVICFNEKEADTGKCIPCIRCGKCIDVCPMKLLPLHLCNYAVVRDWDTCNKYHVMDCVECGACTYVCPSKRQLVQSIRLAKQMIKKGGK